MRQKVSILASQMNLGLVEWVEESARLTHRRKDHSSRCPCEDVLVDRPGGYSGSAILQVTRLSNARGSRGRFGVVYRVSPSYIGATCCLFTVRKHISNPRSTARRLPGECTHHLTMQSAMPGIVSMWLSLLRLAGGADIIDRAVVVRTRQVWARLYDVGRSIHR
jgi:hypothetical protein